MKHHHPLMMVLACGQVKLMMGLLEPTAGVIQRDLGARFALVNQARPAPAPV